jgi:hypothetical protein
MRITWNKNEERFEAQFTSGPEWHADKAAAMDAGFKTTGEPAWVWFVHKSAALAKLREHRPGSGLTISKEALDRFNYLQKVEQKNAELKAYAKEQEKRIKREREREKIAALHEKDGEVVEPEYEPSHFQATPDYWKGKNEITRADLPADVMARFVQHESIPQRRAEPLGKCKICGDSTYFPEDSDLCFWCTGSGEEKFLEELIC